MHNIIYTFIAFNKRRTLSNLTKAGFFKILVTAKLVTTSGYRSHFRSHAYTPPGIEHTLLICDYY